ncbi:MAG: response regulator [Promethearchaeota archaeon]
MKTISKEIENINDIEQYKKETGKNAFWRGNLTENFKKWQKGEYNRKKNKERISIYIPTVMKEEWEIFAKTSKYKTLSKLIRYALNFFIDYSSRVKNNNKVDIDFLSSLSHDLKEPLTSMKGYLQLFIRTQRKNLNENALLILDKLLNQCQTLENRIIKFLDKSETDGNKLTEELDAKFDILLIEDDVETYELLFDYFNSMNISCKVIESGFKAMRELNKITPKLILLDIILPDISGYEIIKKIRKNKKYDNIPVYFMTAIPRHEVEKKVEELNATGFILKPFNLSELEILIKKKFK